MSKKVIYPQEGVAMTCRSLEEYAAMFCIVQSLLQKGRILDVAAGASSLTAELNNKGYEAVAVDPLYRLTSEEISNLGKREMKSAAEKLARAKEHFDWSFYGNLEHHDAIRETAFKLFIKDYKEDQAKKYYIEGTLPSLPFKSDQFSLVLCNHFLFLYQAQFDYDFHLQAIKELIRVTQRGGTILIYPLVSLNHERFPKMDELISTLNQFGVVAELVETSFRFMPAATHLLKIVKL